MRAGDAALQLEGASGLVARGLLNIASRTDLLRSDQSHERAQFDMTVPPYFACNTLLYGPETYLKTRVVPARGGLSAHGAGETFDVQIDNERENGAEEIEFQFSSQSSWRTQINGAGASPTTPASRRP